MQNQPMLISFFQELFKRFATKSPKFFRIWQLVLGALTLITGVPELLEYFNVALPEGVQVLANKAVAMASSGAFVMSLMTTQSTTVGVTDTGEVVKKTNENKLPFTAHVESKAALKMPDAPKVTVKGKDDPADNETPGV